MTYQEPKGDSPQGQCDALQFPCALRDLVSRRIAQSCWLDGLFHVYTEYRGLRYYVASEATWRNANQRAQEYRIAYPRAMTYLRDRADSTQIDGTWQELRAAYERAP